MGDDEAKCGGWTRDTIMELMAKTSGGAEKVTATLVQFKSVTDFGDVMPWSVCDLEFKEWARWFAKCVLTVQQRIILQSSLCLPSTTGYGMVWYHISRQSTP